MEQSRSMFTALDHIVDIPQGSWAPLAGNCCLVSKSWIKRLQLWKKRFPDPSTFPACCTKAPFIWRPKVAIMAADAEASSCARDFIDCHYHFRNLPHTPDHIPKSAFFEEGLL